MGHILEGTKIILREPRFWRYIFVPLLWSALIYFALLVVGYFALTPVIEGLIARIGVRPDAASVLSNVIYFITWILLSGFIFLTTVSLTSSFLWEKLSMEVEEALTGVERKSSLPLGSVVGDSLARGLLSIVIAAASFCCGLFLPVIVPALMAGFLGMLDFTAPSFARYDMTLGQQWTRVTKLKGWSIFWICAGLVTLLPIVNVLCLPFFVAGGTVMYVRSTHPKFALPANASPPG